MSLALAVTAFAACTEKETFSTASGDDYPRIIDPVFPDWTDGVKPVVANISRDADFSMTLTVTPADYCTVRWYLDGEIVGEGKEIELGLMAGTYDFKVEVSTEAGYSTSREGLVQVNPLDGDPWADEVSYERIAAPGAAAVLYGVNLEKVSRIVIGDRTVTEITYTAAEGGSFISYTVPAEVKDGTYRLILVDASGNEFGGDLLTVTSEPMVTSGADRISKSKDWTMTGVNMDKIVSVTLGGRTVNEFKTQTATEIVMGCPDLEAGEYTLTGKASDGSAVLFHTEAGITEEMKSTVSMETTLWSGHFLVDNWSVNFTGVTKDQFADIEAGSVLRVYYSLNTAAEYHQIRTTTTWWNDLPGTAQTDLTADGVFTVTLTQEALDMIQAQDGFICVGHGYYVDAVTVE